MQQTTYGEIPKKKKTAVFDRNLVEKFLESNKNNFKSVENCRNFLYSKGNVLIKDPVANYLNLSTDSRLDKELKNILSNEYLKLEKLYPNLGSFFLTSFFDANFDISEENYLLHRDNLADFFKTLKNSHVKKILNFLIENSSLEYNVEIKSTATNQITFSKSKNINFRIDYDSSYLGMKNAHEIKNFKYIIIDGQIESIGEIYHLLYKAAETKIPYVIFCFGLSSEVKDVILQNNSKGITEIFPVTLKFDENTINILSDLSAVLGSDVVTAQKGQTISQEIKKELKTGKYIRFDRKGFVIHPSVSEERINKHRKFLEKRIENSSNEKNRELLVYRKRRMSSKSTKIFIPDILLKDPSFSSELDYGLRYFSNATRIMKKITTSQNDTYFIPKDYIKPIYAKIESMKNIYENIDKVLLWED